MQESRRAQIEAIFHNFHAIRRAYSGASRFSSRRFGMTFMQASVLMMLMHEHELTISQLAMTLGISRSALSQLLDGLIDRDFIVRTVSNQDRRVAHVALTKRGMEHLKQMRQEGTREMTHMFDQLDDKEIDQIKRITAKLAQGAQRSEQA